MLKKSFLLFLFCTLNHSGIAFKSTKYKLIISLYNETNPLRIEEYKTCLERNLCHPSIDTIHVIYDTSQDKQITPLLDFIQSKNIAITYIKGRPSFEFCFELANKLYPNEIVILSNADIFFNETLALLDEYNFTNKFLAMTRWNVKSDNSIEIFSQYDKKGNFSKGSYNSQDVWIFKTPLKSFKRADFQLGTWACDAYIAFEAFEAGLEVINPCLTIQCCHLHHSGVRNWKQRGIPGAKSKGIVWSTLQ